MLNFIIRRLLYSVVVLFVITVFVFLIVHFLPGDPVEIMLGEFATPRLVATLRAQYGLDKPLHWQYLNWVWRVFTGDWGISIRTQKPVLTTLMQALEPSLLIAIGAWFLSFVTGVSLGMIAAFARGRLLDFLISSITFLGLATPPFFFGLALMILFSLRLGWLPPSGYVRLSENPWGALTAIVLPVLAMGLRSSAAVARITRTAVLDVVDEDYVRVARAKGLHEWSIRFKHVLRTSLITIVTVSGLQLGSLLGGVVILENVFSIPGAGSLVVNAALFRDYPVVQGCVLVFGIWFTLINLIVDLAYGFLDPRIRVE